ncbi:MULTISPECIES: hypothetical protein [Pseudomonas]|uniref:hypothetical protein n=1 Tax=Pseudomonas TaxID=286 RepID=UPI0005A746CB|nr:MULTISPECIES: hypothetical protein [Pseudomonas]AZD93033.1 hypothetical protein C4K13_3616 [Pseudomonas chlororaphis subsp. aureofaciens]KAB0532802.1 hypothetical protein F7R16_11205 [Pseudomonas chlororaphis subsp. aureofaciens]TSD26010.1 hypothetical protein FCE86_031585 [Pseudomonas sp. ATCC 13985]WDG57832.1 hypothetical protein PUP52_18470 [Pseudomonas chlororaphis]WDG64045.1 hypothetical protein PUP59_18475 [Pseudomonas chlororaphis]
MKFKVKAYYNHQKHRALAIPEDKTLDDLSEETLRWIGPEVTEGTKELDTSERLFGFDPQTVWDDFQTKGFSVYEITAKVTIK